MIASEPTTWQDVALMAVFGYTVIAVVWIRNRK